MAKEKPPITVVGDVGGRIAIIVVRCCEFNFCNLYGWAAIVRAFQVVNSFIYNNCKRPLSPTVLFLTYNYICIFLKK